MYRLVHTDVTYGRDGLSTYPGDALSHPVQSPAMGRQELLGDVVAYARLHGIADVSLRELAELVGSSHRMLLYHFGSREGVVAAVVAESEAHERELAASYAQTGTSAVDALRDAWRRLRKPSRAGEERLFFELAAMAMYRRPGTERVADDLVERWVELASDAGANAPQLRLDVAVIRGLLLDLLLTGDRKGTDAAFARYLAQRDHKPAPSGRAPRSTR